MTEAERRFRKNLVAGAMVVAPVMILIGLAIQSSVYSGDNEALYLASIRENADAFWVGNVVAGFGALLLPLVMLGLVHLIRVRKRIYGTVAGTIACMGAFGLGGAWLVGSLFEYQMAHESNQAAMVSLEKSLDSDATAPLIAIWGGFFFGMILVTIGLFLARSIPRWTAGLLAVATIGVFLSDGGSAGELIANGLLTAAFCAIAWSIWKRTPDEWERGELPASQAARQAEPDPSPAAA